MKAWETLSPDEKSDRFYEKQEDLMKFCEQKFEALGVESRDAHAAIGTKIEALEMRLEASMDMFVDKMRRLEAKIDILLV